MDKLIKQIFGPAFQKACNALMCFSYFPSQCPNTAHKDISKPASISQGIRAGCGNCPGGLDGITFANSSLPVSTTLLDQAYQTDTPTMNPNTTSTPVSASLTAPFTFTSTFFHLFMTITFTSIFFLF